MIKERLVEKVLFTELAKQENVDKNPEFIRNMEKIKEELLVNMWLKLQLENTIVSDREAKEFYEKNKYKFKQLNYDKVKEKIITSLKQKKFAGKIAEIAKELKAKAVIVKY
jgi:hypothetical protein